MAASENGWAEALCVALSQGDWDGAKAMLSYGKAPKISREWRSPTGWSMLGSCLAGASPSEIMSKSSGRDDVAAALVEAGHDIVVSGMPDFPKDGDGSRFGSRAQKVSDKDDPEGLALMTLAFSCGLAKTAGALAKRMGRERALKGLLAADPMAPVRAVCSDSESRMEFLLSLGFDPDRCPGWRMENWNPVAEPGRFVGLFAESRSPGMARLLANSGASKNLPGNDGKMAPERFGGLSSLGAKERNEMLDLAAEGMSQESLVAALFAAAEGNSVSSMNKVLASLPKGAEKTARAPDGAGLLEAALAAGSHKTAQALVKRGMSLFDTTPDGTRVFSWGLMSGGKDRSMGALFLNGLKSLVADLTAAKAWEGGNVAWEVERSLIGAKRVMDARGGWSGRGNEAGLVWAMSKGSPFEAGPDGKSAACHALERKDAERLGLYVTKAPTAFPRVLPDGRSARAALLGLGLVERAGDGMWWEAARKFGDWPPPAGILLKEGEVETFVKEMARAMPDSDNGRFSRFSVFFNEALSSLGKAGLGLSENGKAGCAALGEVVAKRGLAFSDPLSPEAMERVAMESMGRGGGSHAAEVAHALLAGAWKSSESGTPEGDNMAKRCAKAGVRAMGEVVAKGFSAICDGSEHWMDCPAVVEALSESQGLIARIHGESMARDVERAQEKPRLPSV